ncbi:hypothetical protein [Yinghuangia sp. YIM S09857]|uniref:hypothetical protein n=1 Tax=Yinghuangia sp. YIM S09857 TaxID=3436929 RepID=UPI003F5369D2
MNRTRDDRTEPKLQTLGGWLWDGARDLLRGDGLTTDCAGYLATAAPTALPGPATPCCTAPDCPNRNL